MSGLPHPALAGCIGMLGDDFGIAGADESVLSHRN
jgi:hypothetical protein